MNIASRCPSGGAGTPAGLRVSGCLDTVAVTLSAGRFNQTARPTRSQDSKLGHRHATPMYGCRARTMDGATALTAGLIDVGRLGDDECGMVTPRTARPARVTTVATAQRWRRWRLARSITPPVSKPGRGSGQPFAERRCIDASISSTMLQVNIDRSNPALLHDQVAAAIRRAIAEGEAGPGERLPPARDMAAVLGVNTNTVLRSLRTLRDEGLLEFRRGQGVHVAGTGQRGAVLAKAHELLRFARGQGYQRDELLEMIKSLP